MWPGAGKKTLVSQRLRDCMTQESRLFEPQPAEPVTPLLHADVMTQLFDTNGYDRTETNAPRRNHLRSVGSPTFFDGEDGPLADRVASWRLDDDTIATGKAGIAKARAALEQAARDRAETDRSNRPTRKAA